MLNKDQYVQKMIEYGGSYVWLFTKQEVEFSKVLSAAKLFNEWSQRNNTDTNLEDYFKDNSKFFDTTDVHRVLVIAQLYGLITKSTPSYKNERVTPIFNEIINSNNVNSFNILLSEQLLKFKLRSIADRSSLVQERHIFPIIFIYQVLRRLKDSSVNSITFDDLYLFVMTMNSHDQVELSVKYILSKDRYPNVEDLISDYKGRSRILKILENLDIFAIHNETIEINCEFQLPMDNFIENIFSKLSMTDLTNDDCYKDFLGSNQSFDTLLIGIRNTQIINAVIDVKEDGEYILETYRVTNLTDDIIGKYHFNHLSKPVTTKNNDKDRVRHRSPIVGRIALQESHYLCEYNELHLTFVSGATGKNYTEAHHLIPMQFQQQYWDEQHRNIDCVENITSLCPNCHRGVHHGTFDEKNRILKVLFDKKISEIKAIGIDLSKEQLIEMYS